MRTPFKPVLPPRSSDPFANITLDDDETTSNTSSPNHTSSTSRGHARQNSRSSRSANRNSSSNPGSVPNNANNIVHSRNISRSGYAHGVVPSTHHRRAFNPVTPAGRPNNTNSTSTRFDPSTGRISGTTSTSTHHGHHGHSSRITSSSNVTPTFYSGSSGGAIASSAPIPIPSSNRTSSEAEPDSSSFVPPHVLASRARAQEPVPLARSYQKKKIPPPKHTWY